jgi:hypothetical protein
MRIRRLALTMLISIPVIVLAPPAVAHHDVPLNNCPFPWSSEDQLTHLPLVSPQSGEDCWRPVIWPGTGKLLSRQDLYQHAESYEGLGFSRNFLWYAERTSIELRNYRSSSWAGCNHLPVGVGTFCGSVNFSRLEDDFKLDTENPTLTVLKHGHTWLALSCGNVVLTGSAEIPVPTITARKFHDLNDDGARNGVEPYLADWPFRLVQETSIDPTNPLAIPLQRSTDTSGTVTFRLDGLSPGRYRVEELNQDGWVATGPESRTVEVHEGIGDGQIFAGEFGNTRITDAEKAHFTLLDPPMRIDVLTDTDLTVRSTIRNNGPGGPVAITEHLEVTAPDDCEVTVNPAQRQLSLAAGQTAVVDATVTVNCGLPSNHSFEFSNQVVVDDGARESDPKNNQNAFEWTVPVYAESDVSVSNVAVACPDSSLTGNAFQCVVTGRVSNSGPYGPIDVGAALDLTGPPDCNLAGRTASAVELGMLDVSEFSEVSRTFDVTCADRSFHDFEGEVAAHALDPHVTDAPGNNSAAAGAQVEVFQDADLKATDVHVECNEEVGTTRFTCRADVDLVNAGPADNVRSIVTADLDLSNECTVEPDRHQETSIRVLTVGVDYSEQFTWDVICPASDLLHPFQVTTDVLVALGEDPHAVDEPGPQSDIHVVPTCVQTVNPHGKQIPQAPGQGQNEDGFYEVGSLPAFLGQEVFIRDSGSGQTFGPFQPGTRVKYVEANGSEPSIEAMAGNRSVNNGSAKAVDYQIKGQGDMVVVVIDEDGGEVLTSCLVPPFPK